MVILVHTRLVEDDTTISGHFLWAEMEIILFIHFLSTWTEPETDFGQNHKMALS